MYVCGFSFGVSAGNNTTQHDVVGVLQSVADSGRAGVGHGPLSLPAIKNPSHLR